MPDAVKRVIYTVLNVSKCGVKHQLGGVVPLFILHNSHVQITILLLHVMHSVHGKVLLVQEQQGLILVLHLNIAVVLQNQFGLLRFAVFKKKGGEFEEAEAEAEEEED